MWPDSQPLRRITRFQTFGLRREWLQLYLDHPQDWNDIGGLGSKQILSVKTWLRTLGIIDGKNRETSFAARCRTHGLNYSLLWQELWVRAVFHFNGAAWYAYQGLGHRSTEELRHTLSEDAPHFSLHGISNCILEVIGLLAHTPIGDTLGQGIVRGKSRRTVERMGLPKPDPATLGLALSLLFQREGADYLRIGNAYLWPWTVFGCTPDVARRLMVDDVRFIWEADAVRLRSS